MSGKNGGKRAGAGRKAGVPNKATRELREMARQYTEDAVATLARIMSDPDEPAAPRVHCAETLLAYGHGKPRQQVEVTGKDGRDLVADADPARLALALEAIINATARRERAEAQK